MSCLTDSSFELKWPDSDSSIAVKFQQSSKIHSYSSTRSVQKDQTHQQFDHYHQKVQAQNTTADYFWLILGLYTNHCFDCLYFYQRFCLGSFCVSGETSLNWCLTIYFNAIYSCFESDAQKIGIWPLEFSYHYGYYFPKRHRWNACNFPYNNHVLRSKPGTGSTADYLHYNSAGLSLRLFFAGWFLFFGVVILVFVGPCYEFGSRHHHLRPGALSAVAGFASIGHTEISGRCSKCAELERQIPFAFSKPTCAHFRAYNC